MTKLFLFFALILLLSAIVLMALPFSVEITYNYAETNATETFAVSYFSFFDYAPFFYLPASLIAIIWTIVIFWFLLRKRLPKNRTPLSQISFFSVASSIPALFLECNIWNIIIVTLLIMATAMQIIHFKKNGVQGYQMD